MNILKIPVRYLLVLALTIWALIPGLSWSHVALTYPPTPVELCRDKGNYNWPADGSGIPPGPCHDQAMVYNTPDERWYPFSHWHEFAALVPGYEDFENVKKIVPDGKLCSAGSEKKKSFDLPLNWERTTVPVVNGEMKINITGTQPHVPSYAKIFMTPPGYQANKPLTWNDLQLLTTVNFTDYRTDWENSVLHKKPVTEPETLGFFEFTVKVPNGQTGLATIYMVFQRLDTGYEGFYNCAFVTLGDGTVIPFPWFSRGLLVTSDLVPKVNESVRLRVFDGSNKRFSEVVDESLKITAQNSKLEQWLPELVALLSKHSSIIQIGKASGSNIVLDPNDLASNLMYVSKEYYTAQVSITGGEGPTPTPTVEILGSSELKSGEKYTFSSKLSNFPGKYQGFTWAPEGLTNVSDYNAPSVSGTAIDVKIPTPLVIRVNVRNEEFGNTYQASMPIRVVPKDGGGGQYPAYKEGTAYKDGDIVTNEARTFKCRPHPFTAWCGGAAWAYAPGKGTAWQEAWLELLKKRDRK